MLSASGMLPKGGPRKTGMHPAIKISLVRRAEALSPGSTRQNSVLRMRSITCSKGATVSRQPPSNMQLSGRGALLQDSR